MTISHPRTVILAAVLCMLSLQATAAGEDSLFVFFNGYRLDVFPPATVVSETYSEKQLMVEVVNDTTYYYDLDRIDSITRHAPAHLPRFSSFKFNNKYNHQLTIDAEGTIVGDSVVTASIGGIGKWLTPSFQLDDDEGRVYVEGKRQYSKQSRHRFDSDIMYTVSRYGWRVLQKVVDGNAARHHFEMRPYGRRYRVHADFLTDNPDNYVPRIDINTATGEMISSKDYYLDATITIDGGGVFPDMAETAVQIKGRGNSSWSSNPWDKNPYRLKFPSKKKPLGLTNGKSWVLLANKQSGSMLSNAIGMMAAGLVGTAAPNHIIPVELYINGDYRGSYNFTEKVGISNNSIDLDNEDSAALLELDTYYDETYRFHSAYYNLPVNIKFPDFSSDPTQITQQMIKDDFNDFMQRLKNGQEIADVVDLQMLVRYLLVTELIANYELHHPKSTYLYKEFVGNTDSKFIFGPIWDLDWAYGYEHNGQYCTTDATADFYTAVWMEARQWVHDLRYVSPQLDQVYYATWADFMQNDLQVLLDYCDDYFAFAEPSLRNNASKWWDGNNYATIAANMKKWLKQRANHIFDGLTVYPIETPEEEDDMHFDDDHEAAGIQTVNADTHQPALADVYDIFGRLVKRQVNVFELRHGLCPGIYIVAGRKMVVR